MKGGEIEIVDEIACVLNVQEYDNEADNLIHGLAFNCSDDDLDLGNCSQYYYIDLVNVVIRQQHFMSDGH